MFIKYPRPWLVSIGPFSYRFTAPSDTPVIVTGLGEIVYVLADKHRSKVFYGEYSSTVLNDKNESVALKDNHLVKI